MRELRFATTVALCAVLTAAGVAAGQEPSPPPLLADALIPNAERPLSHEELLAIRGELGDPDVLLTLVADATIERLPPPRQAPPAQRREMAFGWLPREERHPDDPAVEASRVVRSRYPDDGGPISGLQAFYVTQDIRLRGSVVTPAGSYLTPIEPAAMALAHELPADSLMLARGWLTRLAGDQACPTPPKELRHGRLGGGSPFIDCPSGWLTPEPVEQTRLDEPARPNQFGIRVQDGAANHASRGGSDPARAAATYLLRHIANPIGGAGPAMGWEVVDRLDPVEIPATPTDLDQATRPSGLDWRPVLERQPPADTAFLDAPGALSTAWVGGFASVRQGRDRVLSSWVSADGLEWQSARLPSGAGERDDGIRQVEALLPLDDGLAIIADLTADIDSVDDWRFDVWHSGDGLAWRQVGREVVRTPARYAATKGYHRIVQGFWSVGDRIVAHETYTAPDTAEPATFAWTSRDGARWDRQRVTGLAAANGSRYANVIFPQDDGLYALPGAASRPIQYSTDGARWRTIGRQPQGLDLYVPSVFERVGDAFIIGGSVEEPQGEDEEWAEATVLWHSHDGDRWEESQRPAAGSLIDIAAAGETVIVAGGQPWAYGPDEDADPPWLLASQDAGRTWDANLSWQADTEWCLNSLTSHAGTIVLDAACATPDAASKYALSVDLPPEPEPTPPVELTIRTAREALQCDEAKGIHTRGMGDGNSADPRTAMQQMVRSGTVVPRRGYRVLERSDNAVLYGYRNGRKVKVTARVVRDGDQWRSAGLSRCSLAEFGGKAQLGPGVWLWTDTSGRTIQERRGPEHCGWGAMRILYLTTPGKPENLRNTRAYVRDPEGDARDLWKAPYLRHGQVPTDARFSGYRRDGAGLWLAADGNAAYVKRGNDVEQWPRVSPGIGCA